MRATKQQLIDALHNVASWLDRHDIQGEQLVSASINGWGDVDIHLQPAVFQSLTNCPIEGNGHGVTFVDGVRVVTCISRPEPSEEFSGAVRVNASGAVKEELARN